MKLNLKTVSTILLVMFVITGCEKKEDTTANQPQAQIVPPPTKPIAAPAKPLIYEGPFGLKMGLSLEEAKVLIPSLSKSEQNDWIYQAETAPVSHPDFEIYSLGFSQETGLCRISAIGKDIKSGDSGFEIRSAFESLDESLSKKYGKGKKYDFSSSKYDSSEYWMMYLLKKNRTLIKVWDKENKSTLLNNLSSIMLSAKASDMSTGYLTVTYEFENMPNCEAEAKAQKNKGL